MKEHAFLFGSQQALVGVVSEPSGPSRCEGEPGRLGVLFLNAGVIHRVGPSRLYVTLARAVTEFGCVGVRFDHSGIGDSPVRRDGLPFEESAIAEAREAMDWLQRTQGATRFVLVGLCSGAVTSFDTAVVDERVAGIVLINPQGFDQRPEWNEYVVNRGRARRYLTRSLFSAKSWWNALTGRVDYRRLASVFRDHVMMRRDRASRSVVSAVVSRVAADLAKLEARGVRTLLLCSEGDDGIEYMNVILGGDVRRLRSEHVLVEILPGADHSLTLCDSQRRVVRCVREWMVAFDVPERARVEAGALASVPSAARISAFQQVVER